MNLKLVSLFLILIIYSSCNRNKKSILFSVDSNDAYCKEELIEAKSEINQGKLVYCNYVGNIVWDPFRAQSEMDSLLRKYNIQYKNESSSCVIQENRNYHCYCELMQEKINEKYGDQLISSLRYSADSLWVLKNLDKVFDNSGFSNNWDEPALYPGDKTLDGTNHSGLQRSFEKLMVYPSNYRFKSGENSQAMIEIDLYIDDYGKAKTSRFNYIFWDDNKKENNYNKEHYSYLKKIARKAIEETRWKAARIKGIGVKSKNEIFLYLK